MKLNIWRILIKVVRCIRNFWRILPGKIKRKFFVLQILPETKAFKVNCKKKAFTSSDGDFHIRQRLLRSNVWIELRSQLASRRTVIKKIDSRTQSLFCDFKDNSSTFNGHNVDIPNVGRIPVLLNPITDSYRDTGLELSFYHHRYG